MWGMFRRSSLEKALNEWIEQGGKLSDTLPQGKEGFIKSKREATLVCSALDTVHKNPETDGESVIASSLHALVSLFQNVKNKAAKEILTQEGLPRLRLLIRDHMEDKKIAEGDALFILKILAMYQQREDVGLIADIARNKTYQDHYMWPLIMGQFGLEHPFSQEILDLLRDPLPCGLISVCYLGMVNALAIAERLDNHPFDSAEGHKRLEGWLRDTNKQHYCYAHSATAALPFIAQTSRAKLLKVAMDHPDPNVQMESAWAQVKTGNATGLAHLMKFCQDPRYSCIAEQYLIELGHVDDIPDEVREPNFQALAEMAKWLAHPMEFGKPPDKVELYDTREIYWPPTDDKRQVWLVKYTYEEDSAGNPDIGIGMVGSDTFAHYNEETKDLAPEDLYGIHCCWELESSGDDRAPDNMTAKEGRTILRQWNPGF